MVCPSKYSQSTRKWVKLSESTRPLGQLVLGSNRRGQLVPFLFAWETLHTLTHKHVDKILGIQMVLWWVYYVQINLRFLLQTGTPEQGQGQRLWP